MGVAQLFSLEKFSGGLLHNIVERGIRAAGGVVLAECRTLGDVPAVHGFAGGRTMRKRSGLTRHIHRQMEDATI